MEKGENRQKNGAVSVQDTAPFLFLLGIDEGQKACSGFHPLCFADRRDSPCDCPYEFCRTSAGASPRPTSSWRFRSAFVRSPGKESKK